jgi:hypothetical protein
MEILDAQKERISRFEIPEGFDATSIDDKDTDVLGKYCNLDQTFYNIRYVLILNKPYFTQ